MHYLIKGSIIRSENAAKSPAEASRRLVAWIRNNVRSDSSLDFGCGRLRYTPHLAARSECLAIVDSAEQLNRKIRTRRGVTSVREIALRRWPGCQIFTAEQAWRGLPEKYNFILCANVLSAIPSKIIRRRFLNAIRMLLVQGGQVLVVNQHTNSYFTNARLRSNAKSHLDGWILQSARGAAYYGVLNRDRVVRIMRSHGFEIIDAWIEGQSNWVLGRIRAR
ncbi:MAG: methyltransferase domain-containing protein [Nitrospiraceae bacterium]